jgi:multidrug efflux system membrane fusion protein
MADASTRTYAARVTLSDKPVGVALGMTAEVSFIQPSKKADLLVPSSAIFQQGENAAVWVVNGQHQVVLRPVKISAYRDQGALIASGLIAGERIVSAGVHKLAAGEKVHAVDTGLSQ